MPFYARKNLVINAQGPNSIVFPVLTTGNTLVFDASLGSFISPEIPDDEQVQAINLGSGEQVFEDQVGVQLQFNTLVGGPGVSIVEDNGELIISSSTQTVGTIAERDALIPTLPAGAMVFVEDTGQGEYALYYWNGSTFFTIGTEDSSSVDARTLEITMNWNDPVQEVIGRLSPSSRVTSTIVDVIVPFNDPNAIVTVGDDINGHDIHMPANLNDLSQIGDYLSGSVFVYSGPLETEVKAYMNAGSSTQGQIKIILTYV